MGCFFSKATTKNQNPQNHQPSLPKSTQNHHEQTPPPEEESVKEVLSETPISKPNQVPIFIPETKTQIPLLQNPYEKFQNKNHQVPILIPETKTQLPLAHNPSQKFETNKSHQVPILIPETKTQIPLAQNPSQKFETKGSIEEVTEEVSQLSETTTVTESFSTATTATTATVTEKREDEATSKHCSRGESTATHHHKWNRSPSRKRPHVAADGNVAGGNERRVKSPARRSEPSPEKKMKSGSRLVRGRESGPVANRKINASSAGVRRDSGEGSGRRSRSPSCSRSVGGSSKVGISGGRKQAPVAVENGMEKKSENEEVEEKNDIVSQGESIENPHVSMECFIFL
ncbi:pollen-specific leucine-rich repeat extensin-like protein 2 [Trifolium pratense]|uniref:pollen-specific leucine-rich repeat extensin-like protein 2 n=1 Tax=Trifolium pratense TaxID=57577 RepID=UPI001E695505|nr:pollen-specific leucine-rich repeat extensin-like protein 2 [Trifolium pratense]